MNLSQNPFYILNTTIRDNRKRIMELAEERSLLQDSDECMKARTCLTTPRKRLSAEVAWLLGVGPKKIQELLTLLEEAPERILGTNSFTSIGRANVLAEALTRVNFEDLYEATEWILELAWTYESVDPEEVLAIINEERIVSGFTEVKDYSVVEEEIQNRRRCFGKQIRSALLHLSREDFIEAVTVAAEVATEDGEEHGPVLIEDLVDRYEVEVQENLSNGEDVITQLVQDIRAGLDEEQPDSQLDSMVGKLIQTVKAWDKIAQPIQIMAMSKGSDHEVSNQLAWTVRSLAIHMFNEHGKLEFSQRITDMLQDVFAEAREVAEQTAADATTLGEIASQRALDVELSEIEKIVKDINTAIKSKNASSLSNKVGKLCDAISNWDVPLDNEASQHAAWAGRNLAIKLYNEESHLNYSQQIINVLLHTFIDCGEVSDQISEDAKSLMNIANERNELESQFQEYNLNGNSFTYKKKEYSIKEIRHVGFYRALTTHKTNFVKTGETEEAHIFLTLKNGKEVNISIDEQGFIFKSNKSEQISTIVDFYSYLSNVTFEDRVQYYESQIKNKGYFIYDKCCFYPHKKVVFRNKDFDLKTTSFLRSYGCVEMRKKDYGFLDKLKREVSFTKIPQFSTITDSDVIFYLLDKHFGLRWKS